MQERWRENERHVHVQCLGRREFRGGYQRQLFKVMIDGVVRPSAIYDYLSSFGVCIFNKDPEL